MLGIPFEDVAEKLGLNFIFQNGDSPQKLMPSATSGGCAWSDIDRDGWPDLICPQGGSMDPSTIADSDQVFRNMQGQRFWNCTEATAIVESGYSHGVAVGDFDNDGFDDLYISNVGPDILHRNLGDGTFQPMPAAAGIVNEAWAASAAFGDLDGDGDLDIFVCNYVDYDPSQPIACLDENGKPTTCHPRDVGESANVCFINNADLTFTESAMASGLLAPGSKSLGVVIADLDGDHDADVYVANDTEANHLFVNDGSGNFIENGVSLGVASSGLGHMQASMGVAFGDYDRNGAPDLYVTHFIDDSNTMYKNLGGGNFTDSTRDCGLHQTTLAFLAFGTVMADLDADGWQDLFIANGHIDDWRERTGAAWHMSAQVLRYHDQHWEDVSANSGTYFQQQWLGRGVASCDFDLDGAVDIAVVHQNANIGLLNNEAEIGNFLHLEFLGAQSNRNAIGVEVKVEQLGEKWVQQLAGGTSYCSSNEQAVYIGVGDSDDPVRLSVKWPSGKSFQAEHVSVNAHYLISEANGLFRQW